MARKKKVKVEKDSVVTDTPKVTEEKGSFKIFMNGQETWSKYAKVYSKVLGNIHGKIYENKSEADEVAKKLTKFSKKNKFEAVKVA